MFILGIDPGSITSGWALLKSEGKKVDYIASGILKFDSKTPFLDRLSQIKSMVNELAIELKPDEVALESLIYVKSPTALIKLAQTRGVILSCFVEKYHGKIFEYSPNLVKSTAVGHGHADKDSVQKVLDLLLGKRTYQTHDASDAVAVALCHALQRGGKSKGIKSKGGRSLAKSLAHRINP